MASWQQALAELARDQAGSLKRQAFLLCGDDSLAEDLVQDALVRAFARPLRASRPGAAEAYVRVIMLTALDDLSPRQRACVVLRFYRDLPVSQVAAALGVGEGTVKRYLSEAMTRLAARLSPAGDG